MRLMPVVAALIMASGCSGKPAAQPPASVSPIVSPSAIPAPSATPSPGASVASQAPVSAESNPPGDIPDNVAFVRYTNDPGRYSFEYPESWARTGSGTRVRFTDKLNGINADVVSAAQAPTVESARRDRVPEIQRSVPAFELRSVTAVSLPGGSGVRIVFRRNSDPDPVTGRVYRDEVEEYDVWRAGREVLLQLYGPVGADNVDAYKRISRSLTL